MFEASFLVTLFAVFCCSAFASDVLELHDIDFDEQASRHDVVLVEFFAPWCGHCKRLAPEYEKAATILRNNEPPVALAKVDCTESGKESCGKHGVSGYPSLKIFRGGQFSQDYNGPREANGIVKYMRSQVGPSSTELKSVDDFNKFVEKDEVSIVGLFESETSSLKAAFAKTADKLRESARFGLSVVEGVLEHAGHKEAVVLYRPKLLKNKFEDSEVIYSGTPDAADIQKFIQDNTHGLVGHRTQDSADQFKPPLIVAYYKVDYAKNVKGTNYWRNRILKVASSLVGKVKFAISNKDEFTNELNEYGFDYVSGDKPVVAGKDAKGQKFVLKDEFSVEALEKFANDFIDNKLEPYFKSEPVPETQDGPVKVAVAKNFNDLVLTNDKDVLIEFYAPWCGHCKKLSPVFDELGTLLAAEDGVVIVKMDATANDVPQPFDVQGFPTLYWYPKDKRTPVRYDGGRELDDFIKYIAKHATNELKGYDRKGKIQKSEL